MQIENDEINSTPKLFRNIDHIVINVFWVVTYYILSNDTLVLNIVYDVIMDIMFTKKLGQ